MRALRQGLSRWAYTLDARRRWVIWGSLAAVAALLMTVLPSPWSWVAAAPIVAVGFLLFDAQSRRERDEEQRPR